MSYHGFPNEDAAITHLVHNLVEDAVRSVEEVPIPLTRELMEITRIQLRVQLANT